MNHRMIYPSSGLTALLDALERDLLAAPMDEMRKALGETGRAPDVACQEIRSLLKKAVIASEDDPSVTAKPKPRTKTGLHWH